MQSPSINTRSFTSTVFGLLGTLYILLLACIIAYIWIFAQDRFISVASFKISRQSASAAEIGLAQLALPGLSDSGSADSQIAIGFVASTDLLLELESELALQEHFATPARDFVFRLDHAAPLEQRLEYYRKRIFAKYDKETGLTMLTVDTFEPSLSKKIAEEILTRTEAFINSLNQTIADQQLIFIRNEVDLAEKQVRDASLELLALQNAHNLVSPDEAISASLSTVHELKLQTLRLETTLASIERDSPDSPRIATIRSQLKSLAEKTAIESVKISGPEQDRLNQILARYKELELQLNFAIRLRTGAETLLQKHRVDAAARSHFLSIIQRPFLPEDVGYPRRAYATVTILVLGLLLFLILRVLAHSIYERVR
jgi:capsular polysaccharide transport system permease protein